jgi:hypothetical protein
MKQGRRPNSLLTRILVIAVLLGFAFLSSIAMVLMHGAMMRGSMMAGMGSGAPLMLALAGLILTSIMVALWVARRLRA